MTITLRDATAADAPFIAQCVLAAMSLYEFGQVLDAEGQCRLDALAALCDTPGTLYHWSRTRVAEVDGQVAGVLVSYDGATYLGCRTLTFGLLGERTGYAIHPETEETVPGEYYLDSMAILPAYRTYGIGHLLMRDAIALGRRQGFTRFTLLVDADHPRVHAYYAALGFTDQRPLRVFGTDFIKMELVKKEENQEFEE